MINNKHAIIKNIRRKKASPKQSRTHSRNADPTHNFIMDLQRTAGNRAVEHLIRNEILQPELIQKTSSIQAKEAKSAIESLISMKMAGEGILTGTTESTNSPHEKEADHVAEQIVSMPEATVQKKSNAIKIQAKNISGNTEVAGPALESGIMSMKGSGRSLEKPERRYYEARFNRNFKDIRLHTNSKADRLARSINARAFTTGRDIYFAKGEYQPGTREGKKLLAHELTHVVQQKGKSRYLNRSIIQRKIPAPLHGTNRRSSPGHEAIQADYITKLDPTGAREYPIPGSGAGGGMGYADLVSVGTKAIYEIKPYYTGAHAAGLAQVGRYLLGAKASYKGNWHLGFAYPDRVLPISADKEIVAKQYATPGMIFYYSRNKKRKRQPDPKTVPVTAPETEKKKEINWEKVFDVIIKLGLSILLVGVVLAAILDPEPVSKLVLAGLSIVMITSILSAFGMDSSNPQMA
ncbi:MAG: DUF4157 domain-containing protein [bacterium]|nr:DUF4157 domain-containing protein [bacterium]